jgi:hypothetical protein
LTVTWDGYTSFGVKRMPAVPDLLEKIRRRPGMYLGECSLTSLYHTIGGYALALGVHEIENDTTLRLPDDFNDWVAYRLHYKESTSGWKRMILGVSGDGAAGFIRFFELLDQHTARKCRVVAKLIGFQKTYAVSSGGHERTERYPTGISLIAYTDDPGFFAVSDEPGVSLPMGGFFPSLDWFETFTGAHRSQLVVLDAETFERWSRNAEPSAPPNGGPTMSFGNSGVTEGPPSVS